MEGTIVKIYELSGWYGVSVQDRVIRFKRKSLTILPTKLETHHVDEESDESEDESASIHLRRIIIEDDDSAFIVREATSEDDRSQSSFEDECEHDESLRQWRQQFYDDVERNPRQQRTDSETIPERVNCNNRSNNIPNDRGAESVHNRSSNPTMDEETDHLRLRERNQWLEQELQRMNRLVDMLSRELQSKVNIDGT